jgi:hypothetical protein
MDEKILKLLEIGFSSAGQWVLSGSGILCQLNEKSSATNILYAFSADDKLMYIGKTVQSLSQRMMGYKNPAPSQTTNIKNSRKIYECLTQGIPINIYVFQDNGHFSYGGFHLNLAAALEDSLIRHFSPAWNGSEKITKIEKSIPKAQEIIIKINRSPVQLKNITWSDKFQIALFELCSKATANGFSSVEVRAGDLHRIVGEYPGVNHKMPICCNVMYSSMTSGDTIMSSPPKGKGASLTIKYMLPRS